jgi:hypothetical protein
MEETIMNHNIPRFAKLLSISLVSFLLLSRTLWDIYDTPADNGDGIATRTMVSTSFVPQAYPDNCSLPSDNGYSNETGVNGLNHLDFKANWVQFLDTTQGPLIDGIYQANGLVGGDPN